MWKIAGTILIAITLLVAGAVAGPVLPAEYYGTVTINGNPAPAGTVVTAVINNQVAGSITTTNSGIYGGAGTFAQRLVVAGTENGQTIQFQINGRKAAQTSTFQSGGTNPLFSLSVEYSPGTTPAATTAVPPATVTTTGTPAPEQTLVNPWTPVPTTASATGTATTPSSTPKITPRNTNAAAQPVSLPPATTQPASTKRGTITTNSPVSSMPPATTHASPATSFETMALLGILITAGLVLRK
jgi:hypothetical protein